MPSFCSIYGLFLLNPCDPPQRREGRGAGPSSLLYEAEAKGLHPADVIAALPITSGPYTCVLAERRGRPHRAPRPPDRRPGPQLDRRADAGGSTGGLPCAAGHAYELAFEPEQPEGVVLKARPSSSPPGFSHRRSRRGFVNGLAGRLRRGRAAAARPWRNVSCPAALLVDMDGVIRRGLEGRAPGRAPSAGADDLPWGWNRGRLLSDGSSVPRTACGSGRTTVPSPDRGGAADEVAAALSRRGARLRCSTRIGAGALVGRSDDFTIDDTRRRPGAHRAGPGRGHRTAWPGPATTRLKLHATSSQRRLSSTRRWRRGPELLGGGRVDQAGPRRSTSGRRRGGKGTPVGDYPLFVDDIGSKERKAAQASKCAPACRGGSNSASAARSG